jgi:hypothetical protein
MAFWTELKILSSKLTGEVSVGRDLIRDAQHRPPIFRRFGEKRYCPRRRLNLPPN